MIRFHNGNKNTEVFHKKKDPKSINYQINKNGRILTHKSIFNANILNLSEHIDKRWISQRQDVFDLQV